LSGVPKSALESSNLDVVGAFASQRCRCCTFQRFNINALPRNFTTGLVDTHNHVHQSAIKSQCKQDGTETQGDLLMSAVLAVSEIEWETLLKFGGHHLLRKESQYPRFVIGLGIHPWQVHEAKDGWKERLRLLLESHPAAIVGEIGLCKCAKNLRGPGNKEVFWPLQR
jgi:TatD DNase family protein